MSEYEVANRREELAFVDELLSGLERLRAHMVDLEAMAHAAVQTLDYLPYVPLATPPPPGPDAAEDTDGNQSLIAVPIVGASQDAGPATAISRDALVRIQMDRLQALVQSTSRVALSVLQQTNALLNDTRAPRNKRGCSTAREPRRPGYVKPHVIASA